MKTLIFIVLIYFSSMGIASQSQSDLVNQYNVSKYYLLKNISPSDGLPGAILASPSIWEPNYYFHWVRDAALITATLVDLYKTSTDPVEKNQILNHLKNAASFDLKIQQVNNLSGGLGEPKFLVTGLPFNDPWGRPQFDGPALRAISYINLAEILIQENSEPEFVVILKTIITLDLNFIASEWSKGGFDIWEETFGQHFYTNMVQYKSLILGAHFFKNQNSISEGERFSIETDKIENFLVNYFDQSRNIIIPTISIANNIGIKKSELDSSVILAFIHSNTFGVNNDFLLNTAEQLRVAFSKKYKINENKDTVLIGRYPEDVYDGVGMEAKGGNPWFITTHALAELYCRLSEEIETEQLVRASPGRTLFLSSLVDSSLLKRLENNEDITDADSISMIAEALKSQGIKYLRLSLSFSTNNGHMSEQINRDTGVQQGARDLSWSYSSYLTAAKACGIK